MTKTEYMKTLSHCLRRLPKEDYDRAIEYFEEYFAEAGAENEQQAIEDLGDPEEAAKALILDLASQNMKEKPKTMKRGLSALWVAILAVCAAPIAVPAIICILIVIGAVLLSVGAVLLSLVLSALSVTAVGIISILGGIVILFQSAVDGLCNIGVGLFCTGAGVLFIYGSIILFKGFIRKSSVSLGKLIKGGRRHEKNN